RRVGDPILRFPRKSAVVRVVVPAVRRPLLAQKGDPLSDTNKTPSSQPLAAAFNQCGQFEPILRPRPNGTAYVAAAFSMWVRSKSESARFKRRLLLSITES